MIDSKLAGQINEIQALRIDDRLTDEAVVALMNIHLSVANLIVANNLETEYGSAAPYREAMNRLFAICHKRCRSNQTLARRSRMIPALYTCSPCPMPCSTNTGTGMVEHCAWRAIDEWQKKHDTTAVHRAGTSDGVRDIALYHRSDAVYGRRRQTCTTGLPVYAAAG